MDSYNRDTEREQTREDEILAVLALLRVSYATQTINIDRKVLDAREAVFATILIESGVSPSLLLVAAKQWIADGNPFAPQPGELLEEARFIIGKSRALVNEGKMWQLAQNAVERNSNGRMVFKEGIRESLPPGLAEAMEAFPLQRLGDYLVEDEGTAYAQFRGILNNILLREEKREKLLPKAAELFALTAGRMSADMPRLTPGSAAFPPPDSNTPAASVLEELPPLSRVAVNTLLDMERRGQLSAMDKALLARWRQTQDGQ